MAPVTGVSPSSDRVPMMMRLQPGMTPGAFAKDAIISWFRGEFAAANAIIDALCGHLSQSEGGSCEYESVFAAIHRRRLNWIPILQMQKYFSIADVTHELQKVVEEKTRRGNVEKTEDINVYSPAKEKDVEVSFECFDSNENGVVEVVDVDFTVDDSPSSEITDIGNTIYSDNFNLFQ
ncbi:hypothetical protein R6Q57_028167 [Mikania cordata]